MNPNRQYLSIYQPICQAGNVIVYRVFYFEFWKILFTDVIHYFRSFLVWGPVQEHPCGTGFYWISAFLFLFLLVLACWESISMLHSRHKQAAEKMRDRVSTGFCDRMEKILSRIGMVRSSAMTLLEFAAQSIFIPFMLPIVQAFYQVRFGNVVLNDEELVQIHQTLNELERLMTQEKTVGCVTGNRELTDHCTSIPVF